MPVKAGSFGPGVRMPARFSGSAPESETQIPAPGLRRTSRSMPIALFTGGEVQFLETLDPGTQWEVRKALLRGAVPPSLVALA